VPDWAQSNQAHGWEMDIYSRKAWENAMLDMEAEWTPKMWRGERQEPNILEWFRLEHVFGGMSSRMFYNEVPQPTWYRQQGHLTGKEDDEAEKQKVLYSFTSANQDRQMVFGMDTTTPEGKAAFLREFEALREMAPELIKKEDCILPHEQPKQIS